jgi:hypothetical protein
LLNQCVQSSQRAEANQALITTIKTRALLGEIRSSNPMNRLRLARYALTHHPDHPAGFEGDQLIKVERFLKDLGSGLQPPLVNTRAGGGGASS